MEKPGLLTNIQLGSMIARNKNTNSNNNIIKGKHILTAIGSRPMNLGVPGSKNVITSDHFLIRVTLPS
jgi:hypothetical protein